MSETENSNGGAPPRTDDDHQDATREEVRRVIQEVKKSVAGAAREVGISYPTFAAWLNGTYQGNNDRVEDAAAVWLDARKVKGALGATMPVAPGFIDTAGSVAVISVLEHAQHAPDFVVITGASGLGKTMTCEAYQKRAPSVWIVTCQPCISTPRAILQRIMDEFCGSDRVAGYRVAGAIVKRMQGTGGLLIVDEAQHLSSAALDQLRTIHDLAGIGIALVGNPTIYSRLEGDGRRAQFAQLYSRVGMRLDRQRAPAGDVDLLLDAWNVTGSAERKLVHLIARKPGALRSMSKVLRVAFRRSISSGRETLQASDIKEAWQGITNAPLTTDAA